MLFNIRQLMDDVKCYGGTGIVLADSLEGRGSGPPPQEPLLRVVVSEHENVRSALLDPPECYYGSVSAISSPRILNVPRLAPILTCSIPDVPATPPSICSDPQSIALPSQPSCFHLFGDKNTLGLGWVTMYLNTPGL
jgi:hypothetical protein